MKKYLALLLCAALFTSALPMAALGADDLPESPSVISASEEQETQPEARKGLRPCFSARNSTGCSM